MTIELLTIPEKHLRYQSGDPSWQVFDNGHVNGNGHKFMVIGTERTNRSAAATVIFDGLPVFTVIGSKNKIDECDVDWRWSWPQVPVEKPELETTVRFLLNPMSELTSAELNEDKAVAHMVKFSPSIDAILEEFGGEGHDTVAWVGIIAEALHKAFPDATPDTRGF